jgi:hypothetical protein
VLDSGPKYSERFFCEWGTYTGKIRRIRLEVLLVEILQHIVIVYILVARGVAYQIIGTVILDYVSLVNGIC